MKIFEDKTIKLDECKIDKSKNIIFRSNINAVFRILNDSILEKDKNIIDRMKRQAFFIVNHEKKKEKI